jgi:hypothetical protein
VNYKCPQRILDFSNEANERLSCEHEGEDIEIGFNAKFLIEMLTNLDTDQIKLNMSAPNKAGCDFPIRKRKRRRYFNAGNAGNAEPVRIIKLISNELKATPIAWLYFFIRGYFLIL